MKSVSSGDARTGQAAKWLPLACLGTGAALVVLALKLWLIAGYASDSPYWDQWDGEAANLFDPFLRGDLPWTVLFSPHNEHRILLTRVLALLLLQVNGLWSPLLEMTFNAVVHVGGLAVVTLLFARVVDRRAFAFLALFAAVLFAIPFGWENTLAGFQSAFYFVLVFSVGAIWLLVLSEPLGRRWWCGLASALLAYFSLASGVFALFAAVATAAVQWAMLRRPSGRQLGAVLLLLGLFLGGVLLTPTIPGHAPLKAAGLSQFLDATGQALAWPSQNPWFAVLRNAPLALFVLRTLQLRPSAGDRRWFLVAIALWIVSESMAVGYGRAVDMTASRYTDLYAVGLLANAAAAAALLLRNEGGPRTAFALAACAWVACAFWAFGHSLARGDLQHQIDDKGQASLRQEKNLRAYLRTGDRAAMAKLPFGHLPYPSAERLASILDSQVLRAILPAGLQQQLLPVAIAQTGQAFTAGGAYPATVPCDCASYGSWSAQGGAAMGDVTLRYPGWPTADRSHRMVLQVAGYPSHGVMEFVQDGHVRRIAPNSDPKETWVPLVVAIGSGPFEIRLHDHDTTYWLAVAHPTLQGRVDRSARGLLVRWPYFLFLGLALIVASGLIAETHRRALPTGTPPG